MENSPYELNSKQKKYLAVKRILDIAICLPACTVLSPFMLACAFAVKIDSPGPVLFKQDRIGKDKNHFKIWKFRTMRTDTPKDVPTHMLENPEKYITRTGSFMRKYSLDELPQLYQCLFTNKLSLVGPRPALWNQDDLIEERDKYGVNALKPGITGWAQINGRDELEIPDKAKLDGEYVKRFGLWMDLKCLLGTVGSVLNHDGVKEGGTGEMHKKDEVTSEKVFPEKIRKEILTGVVVGGVVIGCLTYAFKRAGRSAGGSRSSKWKWVTLCAAAVYSAYTVYRNVKQKFMLEDCSVEVGDVEEESEQDLPKRKNILITGANSYIGMSVESWLNKANERYSEMVYQISTLDMQDGNWKEHDFSQYDVVYHVAGIAHADVGNVTEEQKQLYYKVNTELAVEVAEKAKVSGVRQFIFMSSMIIYSGCDVKTITKETEPKPLNFYGDSKWKADQRVREMEDGSFKVVVLRPPMIYGKGSKGNYPKLAEMAGKLPVFPIVNNKRSMLYIDNLCQFVKCMIDNEESGVFYPQNGEYSNTSDMVRMVAEAKGHRIVMLPGVGWSMKLFGRAPGKIGELTGKAFGDSAYEMEMSEYKDKYRVCRLSESIKRTEG